MPSSAAELLTDNNELMRHLIYGPAKHMKTWWAIQAVRAGFHILMIRTEDNLPLQALKELTPEELARVHIIDVREPLGSSAVSIFITRFLKNEPFVWDEIRRQTVIPMASATYPEGSYVRIVQRELDNNCILLLDTLTQLVKSLTKNFATSNGIDLSAAEKKDWEGYGWAGRLMDWMIDQFKALPCHVMIVGHEEVHEKKNSTKDDKGNWVTTVEYTRTQPISTSRNASMRLAKEFTDVFWFDMVNEQIKILTGPQQSRDGGSTHIKPGMYNWKDLSFKTFFDQSGIRRPDPNAPFTAAQWAKNLNELAPLPARGQAAAAGTVSLPIGNQPLNGKAGSSTVVVPHNKPPAAAKGMSLAALMNKETGQ